MKLLLILLVINNSEKLHTFMITVLTLTGSIQVVCAELNMTLRRHMGDWHYSVMHS